MGCPTADQVRRRSRRALPHQAGSARGQGPARRVAGVERSGFQRGQDARRHPRRGLRLPRVQRPPLRQQAADQAEQGGRQTDPGEAPHRAAVPAWDQRSGGDQTAQPDHSGLGRLLPDTGIRRDLRQAGPLPVAAHLQVGHLQPREQTDVLGRSPVFRQVQQGQAGPVGVRRPHKRRLHAQVRLDQHRPAPDRQATGRHPTTPRLPNTGPGDGTRCPCRSTTPPKGSTESRTVAARSAGAR